MRYFLAVLLPIILLAGPGHAQGVAVVTGLSPLTIGAGIGDTLTITGSGFGAVRGNGGVRFSNQLLPEVRSIAPADQHYVSWSDAQIKVIVPGSGIMPDDGPCSGPVLVLPDDGAAGLSLDHLTIPVRRSERDVVDVPLPVLLADRDGEGGYAFHLAAEWAGVPGGQAAILSALDRWACVSGVRWSVGSLDADSTVAHDGEQRIVWVHGVGFPAFRVHRWYTTCDGMPVLDEIDIAINADKAFAAWPATPTSTQWDLRTALMGALGHALGLEAVRASGVMHHPLEAGTVLEGPSPLESAIAQATVFDSQIMVGCALGPLEPAPVCGTGLGVDAELMRVLAPRPGHCHGLQPAVVEVRNAGIAELVSAVVHVSLNGVEQPAFTWNGSLAHGDSVTLELGDIPLPSGDVQFKSWLTDVNSTSDLFAANDTMRWQSTIGTCSAQTVTIGPGPSAAICRDQRFSIHVGVPTGNGRPLTSCRIDHTVDGDPRPTIFWTGNIPTGFPGADIPLGDEVGLANGVPHTLVVTITRPNGVETIPAGGTTAELFYPMDQLTGNYTVGAAGGDFATLEAAIDALQANGLCGDVVFEVQPGTYVGDHALNGTQWGGDRLTIRSLSPDPADVVLRQNDNDPLHLYQAKATIEGVTFLESGNSEVVLVEQSDSVVFRNCVVQGGGSNQSETGYAARVLSSEDVVVEHCTFATDGAAVHGQVANGLTVRGCTFTGPYTKLRVAGSEDLVVQGNTFARGQASNIALLLYQVTGAVDVHDNLVLGGNRGVQLRFCDGTATRPIRLWNNHVSLEFTAGVFGYEAVLVEQSDYVDLYHNTIVVAPAPGTSNASIHPLHLQSVGHIGLFNNVLCGYNGAAPLHTSGITWSEEYTNVLKADHNAYYSLGGHIITNIGNDLLDDLITLQTYLPEQNDHSLEVDPQLLVPDLPQFLPNTVNHALLGAGMPNAYARDRNGVARPAYPTIGAYQATGAAFDLGVTLPYADGVLCADLADIMASLHNYGSDTLHTATVQCRVNGNVVGGTTWNGALAPGATLDSLIIVTTDLAASDTLLAVFLTSVEGTADLVALNDTAQQRIRATGVHGTIPLTASADLDAVIDGIEASGICGDVTLLLGNGTYEGMVEIARIPGASEQARLIIRSASEDAAAVVISEEGSTDRSMDVRLSGHLRFEHLTIGYTWNSFGFAAVDVTDLVMTDCRFPGLAFASSVSDVRVERCVFPEGFLMSPESRIGARLVFVDDSLSRLQLARTADVHVDRVVCGELDFEEVRGAEVLHTRAGITKLTDVAGTVHRPFHFAHNGTSILRFGVTENAVFSARGAHTHIHNNTISGCGGPYDTFVEFLSERAVSDFRFQNNIVAAAPGAPWQLMFVEPSFTVEAELFDRNCYSWTNGLVRMEGPQHETALEAPDLASWRAYSGADQNSFEHFPAFADTAIGDLHIVDDVLLDGRGLPIAPGQTDLDGDPRNAQAPDIGMDEFGPAPVEVDAAVVEVRTEGVDCFADTGDLGMRFKNAGTTPLTAVGVHWSLNGTEMATLPWSGTLAPDSLSPWLTLGPYAPELVLGDTVVVWAVDPNGAPDDRTWNDTLGLDVLRWPLLGEFDLGVSGPADLPTLFEADWHLSCFGVCGPTTFRLIDPLYEQQLTLGTIPGASDADTVTFRGQSGDSTAVLIEWEEWSFPYVQNAVRFENTEHVRFVDLSIRTGEFAAISMTGAEDIRFWSTAVHGNGSYPGLWSNQCDRFTFDRCSFSGGGRGIHVETTIGEIDVRDCSFIAGNTGMYLGRPERASIERSIFEGGVSVGGGWDSVRVDACRFRGAFSASVPTYLHAGPISLTNNWFDGPGAVLTVFDADTVTIAHNSLRNTAASANGVVFQVIADHPRIVNNAVQRTTPGIVCRFEVDTDLVSDHNVWSGDTASALVQLDAQVFPDLAAWQATGHDLNSYEVQPFFGPVGDPILSPILDDRGMPLPEVTHDISGLPRDPLTPVIGADEFLAVQRDIGAVELAWHGDPCTASVALQARFKNFGAQTITSATLEVRRNGNVVGSVPWTGSVPVFAESAWVPLGTFSLPSDTTLFSCRTVLPNGGADQVTANDTVPADITVFRGMVGVIPVGPGHPYTDMHAITEAFRLRGICGPVTVAFESGTYEGEDTLYTVYGTSAQDTIVFTSMAMDPTAVLITPSFWADGTLSLDGTDHITFQHLTFTTRSTAVMVGDSVEHLRFDRCAFLNEGFGMDPSADGILCYECGALRDVTIDRCSFTGLGFSIRLQVDDDRPGGGVVVTNNTMEEAGKGLHVQYMDSVLVASNVIHIPLQVYANTGVHVIAGNGPVMIRDNEIHTPRTGIEARWIGSTPERPVEIIGNAIVQPYGQFYSTGIEVINSVHVDVVHNTVNSEALDHSAAFRVTSTGNVGHVTSWNNIWSAPNAAAVVVDGDVIAEIELHHDLLNGGDTLVLLGTAAYPSLVHLQQATDLGDASHEADPAFVSSTDHHITYDPFASGMAFFTPSITTDIDGEPRSAPTDIGCDEFGLLPLEAASVHVDVDAIACDSAMVGLRIANLGADDLTGVQLGWQVDGGPVHFPIPWNGSLASYDTTAVIILGGFPLVGGGTYAVSAWAVLPNGTDDPIAMNDTITTTFAPSSLVDLGEDRSLCPGSSVPIDAGDDFATYLWSTGATEASILVDQLGTYSVLVTTAAGCPHLDEVVVYPTTTPEPHVTWNGLVLYTNVVGDLQWLLAGTPVLGATQTSHTPEASGWYSVQLVGADGCVRVSGPVYVSLVGIAEIADDAEPMIEPNPAKGAVRVHLPPAHVLRSLRLIDAVGKTMSVRPDGAEGVLHLALDDVAPGAYTLEVTTTDGTHWMRPLVIVR